MAVLFNIRIMGYHIKQVSKISMAKRKRYFFLQEAVILQNSLSQDVMDARNLCEFRMQQIILTEIVKKKYISDDPKLQIIERWGSSPPSVDCVT